MKNDYAQTSQSTHRLLLVTCVAALAVAFITAPPPRVRADDRDGHNDHIVTPRLPPDLDPVPAGRKVFLEGHATGTQDYICLPSTATSSGRAWTFFGPQATLFNDEEEQITTHFLSPNPDPKESGTLRPTWQHSRDTSTVWAMSIDSSSHPAFVNPGAIPWLLLKVVGVEPGPTDGHSLTKTAYIQRLNTEGGAPPSIDCPMVGEKFFAPDAADYFFYKATLRK